VLAEIVWNSETLGILMGCGIPIVGIIAYYWYRIAKTTAENDLKRTLAERGMSAEDIERVVAAKPNKKGG